MAKGLNKVMLIGYTADEPQVRLFGQNGKVANVTVVTNDRQKNNETGVWEDVAEWHRIVLWYRLADYAELYVHKGNQVYIEGKIKTRSYTDKTGMKRYSTEIHADQIISLGSRRDQAAQAPDYGQNPTYGNYNAPNNPYNSMPQNNFSSGAPNFPSSPNNGQAPFYQGAPTNVYGNMQNVPGPQFDGQFPNQGGAPAAPMPHVANNGSDFSADNDPWAPQQDNMSSDIKVSDAPVASSAENGGGDDDIPF